MRILERHLRCLNLSVVLFFLFSDFTLLVMAEPTRANIPPDQPKRDNSGDIEFETQYFTFHDTLQAEIGELDLPESVRTRLRSEKTAMNWAMLPGLVVRGLGHLYAGDKQTFTKLLLIEVGCLAVGGVGFYFVLSGGMSGDKTTEFIGKVMLITSVVGFIASWIYDANAVAGKVREYNRKIIEDYLKNR